MTHLEKGACPWSLRISAMKFVVLVSVLPKSYGRGGVQLVPTIILNFTNSLFLDILPNSCLCMFCLILTCEHPSKIYRPYVGTNINILYGLCRHLFQNKVRV